MFYEVFSWDGLRCHDVHSTFHRDWLSFRKLIRSNPQKRRQKSDIICIRLILLACVPYFENMEVILWYNFAVFCLLIPVSTLECLNQFLWKLECILWHVSPFQRRTLHPFHEPLSLYVYHRVVATQRAWRKK